MRKIVSLILAGIVLLSTFCTMSYAESSYSEVKNITQNSGWYTKSGDPELVYDSWTNTPYISFNWGNGDYDKQMFEFDLPENGKYAISINSKQSVGTYVPRTALYVEQNGEYKRITELSMPGTGGQFMFTKLAVIDADAGLLKIRVDMTFADIVFNAVKVELLTAPTLESVTVGDESLAENDTINRGTDSFCMTFSGDLKALDENMDVSVMCGSEEISSISEVSGNKLNINLLQTLDYEKNYVIKVAKLKDVNDIFAIDTIEFPFITGGKDGDGAMSFASELYTKAVYEDVTIGGTVIGSKGKGIAGRNVEIFLKDKSGNVSAVPVAKTISGKNGAFSANFKIAEGSEAGLYTCLVTAEYQMGPIEKQFNFVSRALETELLGEISKIADETDIGTFLSEHKEELMISPETDMEGIVEPIKFYKHFKEETYKDGDAFREFYKTNLYLEKLNQATSADKTDDILSNEEACNLLNISSEKIAFIENERSGFVNAVFALGEYENAEELSAEIAELINTWLKIEYSLSNSESVIEDISVEVGQEVILSLDLADAVTDADKLTYIIAIEDEECAESEEVKLLTDGDYELSKDNEKIEITITPIRPLKNVKEIGELSLVASKAGEYDIKIGGNISYIITKDGNVTDAKAVLNEKTIKLTIKEKTVNKTPNRGSTTPSKRGGGGTFIPPVTEPTTPPTAEPTDEPVDVEKFEFTDIEEFEWAKEGIYGLLEKGVISESEDKCFNPSANIKREEFIKMLVEAFGLKKDGAECAFDDVPKESWFYIYVASAVESGLTSGIGNNLFGSGELVTREEMATFIYRAIKNAQNEENAEPFADDEEISEYAKEAVYHIASKGIINGVGENKFAPKANATRAQAAKVIYGMVKEGK